MKTTTGIAILSLLLSLPAGTATPEPVFLDQGWTDDLREQYYFTPQGSHMIPVDWFRALERPDGSGQFAEMAFLQRFGFIAADLPSKTVAAEFPVGMTVDPDTGHLGLTCAACHTANVEVGGETLRIDGAPGHLDFDAFYQTLAQAVALTLIDPARFERFAGAVGVTDDASAASLKAALTAFNLGLTADAVLRKPALASGFGRVDALTQIVNSMAVRDQQQPQNLYPVAAPTSYPPLWLAPDLEFVQWNPIAASPLARNGGQVLGVFGRTSIAADAGAEAFQSTIRLAELHELELWLQTLAPPTWDEARMGPIDRDLAGQGEVLFAVTCSGCHNMAPYERTDPADNFFGQTFIRIGRVDFRQVGTDPTYVRSLLTRAIATNATTAPLFDGAPIVPALAFFGTTVGATVRQAMAAAGLGQEEVFAMNGYRFRTGDDGAPVPYAPPNLTDIKASPLAGVWATGPYLHNGSVPTIYEVLSPDDRREVFWTGGRTLDLDRLGYASEEAPGLFRFDTRLPGNGNGGHDYGAALTHDERMAIIEYLKTQ